MSDVKLNYRNAPQPRSRRPTANNYNYLDDSILTYNYKILDYLVQFGIICSFKGKKCDYSNSFST